MPALIAALLPLSLLVGGPLRPAALPASPGARAGCVLAAAEPPTEERAAEPAAEAGPLDGVLKFVGLGPKEGEEGMTIEKVASLGLAGVLSIAVAETVFWVLSFPTSELVYYIATGEWIDLFSQEGQVKFEFARKDGDDAAAEESDGGAPAEAAAPFEMPKFELPKDLSLPKLPEGFELPKLPKF